MKDLKAKLFEETRYHLEEYNRLKKEYGEWDSLVNNQLAKFTVLYDLIVDSGLENEYIAWRGFAIA